MTANSNGDRRIVASDMRTLQVGNQDQRVRHVSKYVRVDTKRSILDLRRDSVGEGHFGGRDSEGGGGGVREWEEGPAGQEQEIRTRRRLEAWASYERVRSRGWPCTG